MRVTYHAGERLLQRVFQFTTYTKKQIYDAIHLIERDIRDIQYIGRRYLLLPSFPGFYAVVNGDTLVTIVPKNKKSYKK
jgi:hypothetical protein